MYKYQSVNDISGIGMSFMRGRGQTFDLEEGCLFRHFVMKFEFVVTEDATRLR